MVPISLALWWCIPFSMFFKGTGYGLTRLVAFPLRIVRAIKFNVGKFIASIGPSFPIAYLTSGYTIQSFISPRSVPIGYFRDRAFGFVPTLVFLAAAM